MLATQTGLIFSVRRLPMLLTMDGDKPDSVEAVAVKDGRILYAGTMGYYAALLTDGPLTLQDLDAAFPDTPVLISTLSTLTGQLLNATLNCDCPSASPNVMEAVGLPSPAPPCPVRSSAKPLPRPSRFVRWWVRTAGSGGACRCEAPAAAARRRR